MEVSQETPRTEITIQGAAFIVPEPFTEGYTLKANEAAALNQVLAENLRNNFAKRVKDALEEVGGSVEGLDVVALQAELDAYVGTYEFGARKTGTRVSLDPVEREARKQAAKKIREALRKKGIAQKDMEDGQFDSLVDQLASRPEIIEAARRIVEATSNLAGVEID